METSPRPSATGNLQAETRSAVIGLVATLVLAFHITLLPVFTQRSFLPPEVVIFPGTEHLPPAFAAANDACGISPKLMVIKKTNNFIRIIKSLTDLLLFAGIPTYKSQKLDSRILQHNSDDYTSAGTKAAACSYAR
jgi:hypothetical protein